MNDVWHIWYNNNDRDKVLQSICFFKFGTCLLWLSFFSYVNIVVVLIIHPYFNRCAVSVTVTSLYFLWLSPCWINICRPLYLCPSPHPVWLQRVSWWPQNWQKVTQLVQIPSVQQQSTTFSYQICGWVFHHLKKQKQSKVTNTRLNIMHNVI